MKPSARGKETDVGFSSFGDWRGLEFQPRTGQMNSSRSSASLHPKRAQISPAMKRKHGRIIRSRPGNKDAVKMKVEKLQKIVPGGDGLKTERLLSCTADYIVHMRFQVNLLQALLKLHHPNES